MTTTAEAGPGAAMPSSSSSSSSHITTKIAQHTSSSQSRPFWSLEFFPPKTSQGQANLLARMSRMNATLSPQWNHVTWGAGGSTKERSLKLAARGQRGVWDPVVPMEGVREDLDREAAMDSCLHLTCTNVDKDSLDETLEEAKRLGIRNILALRGDPPRGDEYWVAADSRFQRATDLVEYIRQSHGDFFCIGVAGYPEGYCDSLDQDIDRDVRFLKAKQDCGADFVVTQLFYDVDVFVQWYRRCREAGITIPILPGIMPIQNYQSFRRMTNLCKSKVPPTVLAALEPIRFDDAAVKEYGVHLAISMIARLYLETDIRGFHLCTLNLEKSVRRVLEGLGWVECQQEGGETLPATSAKVPSFNSRDTQANIDYRAVTEEALARAQAAAKGANRSAAAAASDATWDEFPNGRFGDARSPAFGEIDGYGVSLKVPPADALRIWGYPVSDDDISAIFSSYLVDKIQCIPWCDAPIFDETLAIQQWLLALNAPGKGWWTVGSQPAVDGVSSADPTYGFGPRDGYVYQKAFVEFFMSESDKDALAARIEAEGQGKLTFFAGNRRGDFETNMPQGGQVEAVTWGIFPGKEIAQPTIIEEESFKAWRDEAFDIWREWESLFPKRSATAQLMREIGEKRWLVTVVHHDYKDEAGLWRFLGAHVAQHQVAPQSPSPTTVVSAPGKVLVAGGYLVLSPAYPGLVISTDARFYSVIAAGTAGRLSIRSPQFTQAVWHFDLDIESGALSLSSESASSPYAGRSPFLCLALVYSLALAYQRVPLPALRAKLAQGLEITVVADNDFYSQKAEGSEDAPTSQYLSSLAPFHPLDVAIRDVHKTGLGSSAALTTSLVSSLLLHLGVVRTLENDDDLALAHNTAQLAHCAAQGKVGSGFDVSAAVWGSQIYRRFDAKVLEPLLASIPKIPVTGAPKGEAGELASLRDVESLGPHLDPLQQPLWKPSPLSATTTSNAHPTAFEGLAATTASSTSLRPAPLSLPAGISLLLADVDAGSNTPSLVSSVQAWRTKKPEWAKQLYDVIASSNSALADAFARMALAQGGAADEYKETLEWAKGRKSSEWGGVSDGCGHGHAHGVHDGGETGTTSSTRLAESETGRALIAARDALRSTRAGMRELGRLSGAPVEPDSMGRVLSAAIDVVPGVLGGGVPGAGGYDALYVLYVDAEGRREALEETLRAAGKREKGESERLRVGVLMSGAGTGGVRAESLQAVRGLRERAEGVIM